MFVERFEGTTAAMAGAYLMLPEVVGIASRFASASLTDRLLLQEGRVSLLRVRRASSSLAFVGQGVAMLTAVHQTQPSACVFALTLAAASQGVHSCGFKANYLDLTSAHSGALAGIGNTFASIASAAGPVITSAALARAPGDWESLFGGLFMLNVSGAAVVLLWLCVENLDTRRKPSEDGKDATSVVWSFSSLFGFSLSRSSP